MTRRDLMRRVGRLEQVAGVRLVSRGDGAERGVRVLAFRTGTGFSFDVLVDRSMDVGRCELSGQSRMGQSRFAIDDEVTNVGFDPTTHMYLYHVNVGWLVVDEASAYLIPAPDGVPVAAYPTHDYRRLTPPNPAFAEECYEHSVVPERGGTVPVGIVNRRLGLGLYQVYRSDQFPFHTMWRMLGEGIYGVAMEPTTNRDAGRFDARERGELGYIAPQESRGYDLEIGALDGADAIDAFAQRVEAVTEPHPRQGSRSRA